MRHIPIEALNLPDGWEDRAQDVRRRIENFPPDKRTREINRHAKLWGELKNVLETLSNGKCWYCETIQNRSDNAVDHFRPKARVIECENHEGYWWLAFDWKNYRYSCTYCNSRRKDIVNERTAGKHDHFPLLNEGTRAFKPEDDLDHEEICLLDPTRPADPGLLWFDQNGNVVPQYKENPHLRLYQRGKMSIDLYHLNFYKTQSKRQVLYNDIKTLIDDGDKFFNRFAAGDQVVEHALNKVIKELIRYLRHDAEYSAAARAYLMGLRYKRDEHGNLIEREWLNAVLASH